MLKWPLPAVGAALFAGALGSCELGPNYQRPPLNIPAGYRGTAASQPASTAPATQASRPLERTWWTLFGDDDLTRLEQAAIVRNPNLKVAMDRVIEARAAAREVKSAFYPQIGFSPTLAETLHTQGKATTTGALPFDLSYEVDLWGQIARSLESANATTRYNADQWGVALLTLEADVAQHYFNLRAFENETRIIDQNVALAQQQLDLYRRQLASGIISRTSLAQETATIIDPLTAQKLELVRQRDDEEHALAILTGVAPSEFTLAAHPGPTEPPEIPSGLPAELLRRRPDVAAAEENLIAANANIGVAITQFYPTVSLIGTAGYENVNLLSAANWQDALLAFGPSVSVPLFTGGRLNAQLQQTQARYQELLETYRGTLLTAFSDVENSLTDVHLYADELAAWHKAVADARDYFTLTQTQYQQGLESQITVLDAQRTLLSNQNSEAQVLNNRLIATVLLIKALGGGWDSQTPLKSPQPIILPPGTQPAATTTGAPGPAPASAP